MNNLIIGLIVVLVTAVFFVVFRISNLASIIRSKGKNEDEIDVASNNVHAYLFLLLPFAGTVWVFWYAAQHISLWGQPDGAAHVAKYDWLSNVAHIVIILMFLITNAVLFYFAFKYRHKKNYKATFYPDN